MPRTCLARGAQRLTRAAAVGCALVRTARGARPGMTLLGGAPGGCCARPTWLALRWEDHAGTSVGKWRQMRRFGAPRQRSRARGATRDAEAYDASSRPCHRGAAAVARPVSAPMGTTQCATPACRRPARTAARRRAQRVRGRASPTVDWPAFAWLLHRLRLLPGPCAESGGAGRRQWSRDAPARSASAARRVS